jgi:hypothetical protein
MPAGQVARQVGGRERQTAVCYAHPPIVAAGWAGSYSSRPCAKKAR